jgi:CRISPR-associated protein Cas5d
MKGGNMVNSVRDGPLQVQVWGEFACFTRPEMKVERVSYPVMTPSAARGVLEAIFWKPEFDWCVEQIEVLREIRFFSILRNEVNSRQSERVAHGWIADGRGFIADDPTQRAQRHTLALRDVAYRITASIDLRPHATDDIAKYRDQFRRRVENGRCFATPYLGCREFSASFGSPSVDSPIDRTEDLGSMLLDIDYAGDGSGRGTPRFFAAKLEHGILRVPAGKGVAVASPAP